MKCSKCNGLDTKKTYEASKMSWNSVCATFTTFLGVGLIVMSLFGRASAIVAFSVFGLGLLWMKLAEKSDDKKFGQKWICHPCNYSFEVKT